MTGFIGGKPLGGSIKDVLSRLVREEWHEFEQFRSDDVGLGVVHHGEKDPDGCMTWQRGRKAGAVYGTITNLDELGLQPAELFERALKWPQTLLPELDGPFVLVCVNERTSRIVLATDRLGTRPCYYTTDSGLAFASDVGPLVPWVDDPSVDQQAVSDLLLLGQVWGEKTLVRDVHRLPPGTVLEYEDGTVSRSRYWEFSFGDTSGPGYVDQLVQNYRNAVEDIAETVSDDVGVWLSGGLDSRALAAELNRSCDSLCTFTYDANPPGGVNLDLARRTSEYLGVENFEVELSPDRFAEILDRGIQLTDGMVPWTSFLNLSSVFNLSTDVDVLLEASGQGVLLGSGLWQSDIEKSSSPEEAVYRGEHRMDVEDVTRLLATDVDPMRTLQTEVDKSSEATLAGKALDVLHRNYFTSGDFLSNKVARSQVGTRVPYANRAFLSHLTTYPAAYRERAWPFTNGAVPFGCAPLKLELVRELDEELASIPYERTRVSPKRSLWQHAVGFVVATSIDRLRGRMRYGGATIPDEWYRDHAGIRDRVDRLLEAACDRPFFNEAAIWALRQEHLRGEANHIFPISCITTIESWVQRNLDVVQPPVEEPTVEHTARTIAETQAD